MGLVMLVLGLGSLIAAIISQTGNPPRPILWVSVILLSIAVMLLAAKDYGYLGALH
jgi:hypothetical protein